MTQMRMFTRVVWLAVLVGTTVSCGDVARQGQSPVYLVIESLEGKRGGTVATGSGAVLASDVITNVTTPEPCTPSTPCPTIFADGGLAKIRLALKDIGNAAVPTAPTSNNAVTLNRYRVVYRRADGRNTPGIDVPYGFDGAVTVSIFGGSTSVPFELVRVNAKAESPLVQMKTNGVFLTTLADVTFYGQDQVGNDVSVTGTIQIDFGNFGDN